MATCMRRCCASTTSSRSRPAISACPARSWPQTDPNVGPATAITGPTIPPLQAMKGKNMSRITLIDPSNATGTTGEQLAQIKSAFGMVPNMFRAAANSPAALASMWGSFGALGGGRLGARLGEQIAVAIADRNNCNYCLAAHTGLGRKAGASVQEMAEA